MGNKHGTFKNQKRFFFHFIHKFSIPQDIINYFKMAPGVDPIGEGTKHSVHTLVFRSQKRSHEMFIHDQGNLPETDKEIDAMIKKIKSKSYYSQGLVQHVDREQAKKQAMESRIEVSNPESVDN